MRTRTPIVLSERDVRRFWMKVALPDENGCMLWMAHKHPRGYGVFRLKDFRVKAHRVSLQLAVGDPTSDNAEGAHSCRRTDCVAPAHLRWATPAENSADKLIHGTHTRGQRSGNAKLTWLQVQAIRGKATRGTPGRVLADEYGVTPEQIGRIIRGKQWIESDVTVRRPLR